MKAYSLKTPGLYLRDLESEFLPPHLSAVTGFVGTAAKGPLYQPQPIKSWGEFLEIFGEVVPFSYLAPSVYGFFLNGGELCFIVRTADTKNRSTPQKTGNCEKITPLKKASRLLIITSPDKHLGKETFIKLEAIDEGSWGNHIKAVFQCIENDRYTFIFTYKDRKEIFANLSLSPGDPAYFVDVINGDPSLTDYVQRKKNGLSILVHVEPAQPVTGENPVFIYEEKTEFYLEGGGDGFINAEGRLKDKDEKPCLEIVSKIKGKPGCDIRVKAEPFTTKTALKIADNSTNEIIVENIKDFLDAAEKVFDETLEAEKFTLDGKELANKINEADKAKHALIFEKEIDGKFPEGSTVSVENRFNIIIYSNDTREPVEVFRDLSMNPQSSRYFENMINHKSGYICAHPAEGGTSAGPPVGEVRPAGGKYPGEIDYRFYTGYEDDGNYFDPGEDEVLLGLAALENTPYVNLVAIPDLVNVTDETFGLAQRHILSHCCKMGDRFAILDTRRNVSTYKARDFPAKEARFGALYYPWLYCIIEGKKIPVPPSGFAAGIIAETDRLYGINKAPANVKLQGVVDIEISIDNTRQEEMNLAGINCIRKFEDGVIKVWGGRTLSMESQWLYIDVRRVFLHIIKTLPEKLSWAVFEPNTTTLWKQIEASITSFLVAMAAKGMTAGSKPGEAFFVRCNQELNTGEVVEAGRVIVQVGVALAAPAEFIIITIKKTPGSLSIIEEEV